MQPIFEAIFLISNDIRYVAVYTHGELNTASQPGRSRASAAESDKYEELIVNPTLLTLVRQRGDIDCGGVEYVLIRYGNFFQFVAPLPDGHISVCIEPQADPLRLVTPIREAVKKVTADNRR